MMIEKDPDYRKKVATQSRIKYIFRNDKESEGSEEVSDDDCSYKTADKAFVMIKEEAPDDKSGIINENRSFCRCCFKLLYGIDQLDQPSDEVLRIFQDITQLELQTSPLAMEFCDDCSHNLLAFENFRKVAIVRQQNFNQMLSKGLDDFSEVHEINQFEAFIKNEPEDHTVIEDINEAIKTESPPPQAPHIKPTRKSGYKKTCPLCNKVVLKIRQHMLQAHKLKCQHCSFVTVEDSKMSTHMRQNHKEETNTLICPICGKVYGKYTLSRHIRKMHYKIKNFFCDICGHGALHKRDVEYHMVKHISKSINCPHCAFVTKTLQQLKRHVRAMHDSAFEKKFACPECNQKFKHEKHVEGHILRKHRKVRNFNCDQCGRGFFGKNEYT